MTEQGMYFVTSVYEECYKRADMHEPMSKEVKQRRQKMIGHILKQDQNSDCNIAMTWATEGKRRKGKPKTTWPRLFKRWIALSNVCKTGAGRGSVEKEGTEADWQSWEELKTVAVNREK